MRVLPTGSGGAAQQASLANAGGEAIAAAVATKARLKVNEKVFMTWILGKQYTVTSGLGA